MSEKFPLEVVGENVIIDPLPEAYKGLIQLPDNYDFEQLIVNPEGIIVAKGDKVKDYSIGNKVVFKMGIAQPHIYKKKLYYIISYKELIVRLPKDYELQSREDAEYLENRQIQADKKKKSQGIIH